MADEWMYTVGGILVAMIVIVISYQLVSSSIRQMQAQNFNSEFTDLYTDIDSFCLQEIGTSNIYNFDVPYSVRIIYATNDTENPLPTVSDKIQNKEISIGDNLCFQYKAEQEIRCAELNCNISMPYLGALETYNDFRLFVNKILGKPLSKTYTLKVTKFLEGVAVETGFGATEGKSCSSDTPCSYEASYCWSQISPNDFTCHITCGPAGSYSLNSYSCCSKDRDSTSSACIDSTTTIPSGGTTSPPIPEPEFTILFIQLQSSINNFNQKTQAAKDKWVAITPLSSCPENVKTIVVEDKVCQVPNQDDVCKGRDQVIYDTIDDIHSCANSWGYTGLYTRVVGVLPGDSVCKLGNGYVGGYTTLYADWVVSAEDTIMIVCTHEMAHTFGLCDEGYSNIQESSCPSGFCAGASDCKKMGPCQYCCPNRPEKDSIMCSSDLCSRGCTFNESFAPSSYTHLVKELNRYCGG